MAAAMVQDEQLANELRLTAGALTRSIERLVVAARVELGTQPADAALTIAELVGLAARRARREGRPDLHAEVQGASSEVQLRVPGTWAERLVADLLHLAPHDHVRVAAEADA